MIGGFKKNYWYRFNGKAKSVYIYKCGDIDVAPHEEFMLDGKWHQCKEEGNYYFRAKFYDSFDPNRLCTFGDDGKPKGENLYMFDEMSPAMYNIKKLNELKNDRQF